ncbi:MAG: hypothetical protein GEU78_17910, partial [Actinobacteria bacterium]|nr:hypothetical protein [Actinomycetota bacterium]
MPDSPPESTFTRRTPRRFAVLLALVLTIPVVWAIVETMDRGALSEVLHSIGERPFGLSMVWAGFGAAFLLRALAWRRVLPDLPLRHAVAALHVALGANHVLPLRLGEPLRIVSVVRRAGIDWRRAAASTITLRAADTLAVMGLGVVAGMGYFRRSMGVWLVAGLAGAVAAGGIVWL